MITLSAKRESMRKEQRQAQIHAYMTKTRYEFLAAQVEYSLSNLIEATERSITFEQMQHLLNFAHQDFSNAIIHLGNLIIDDILPAAWVGNMTLQLGKDRHWPWLIRVLIQHQQSLSIFFHYAISKIILLREECPNSWANCLAIFQEFFQTNQTEIIEYLHDEKDITMALYRHAFHDDEDVCSLAYSIICQVTCQNYEINSTFLKKWGRDKILKLINNGLLKLQKSIRIDTVEIASSFLELSGFYSREYLKRIICIDGSKSGSLALSVSLFFGIFARTVCARDIVFSLDSSFFECLKKYAQLSLPKSKNESVIRQNTLAACTQICKRIEMSFGPGVAGLSEKFEALGLLLCDKPQKIEEECTRIY